MLGRWLLWGVDLAHVLYPFLQTGIKCAGGAHRALLVPGCLAALALTHQCCLSRARQTDNVVILFWSVCVLCSFAVAPNGAGCVRFVQSAGTAWLWGLRAVLVIAWARGRRVW